MLEFPPGISATLICELVVGEFPPGINTLTSGLAVGDFPLGVRTTLICDLWTGCWRVSSRH